MRGPAVEIDRIVREVLAELPAGSADAAARARASANGNGLAAARSAPDVPFSKAPWNNGATRGMVITLSDLDGRLDGLGELVVPKNAVITPLARDHLRERGIRLKHAEEPNPTASSEKANATAGGWGYAVLHCGGLAEGAVQAVARQGTPLTPIAADCLREAIRACADGVAQGRMRGAILFCDDAALAACAANKRPGIRAAVGESPQQVARVLQILAANVLAVEPAGKTLHELRNILRAFCSAVRSRQPSARVLELLGEH